MILDTLESRRLIFFYQYERLSIDMRIAFKAYIKAICQLNKVAPISLNTILQNKFHILYFTHTKFTMQSMADFHIHSITKRHSKHTYGTN